MWTDSATLSMDRDQIRRSWMSRTSVMFFSARCISLKLTDLGVPSHSIKFSYSISPNKCAKALCKSKYFDLQLQLYTAKSQYWQHTAGASPEHWPLQQFMARQLLDYVINMNVKNINKYHIAHFMNVCGLFIRERAFFRRIMVYDIWANFFIFSFEVVHRISLNR